MPRRKSAQGQYNEVVQILDKFKKVMTDEAEGVVTDCADEVLKKAKEFCPIETTALRESGRVESDIKRHGFLEKATAEIVFGGLTPITGKNSPDGVVRYAGAVHEEQRPFLREALTAVAPKLKDKVKQRYSSPRLKKRLLRLGPRSR